MWLSPTGEEVVGGGKRILVDARGEPRQERQHPNLYVRGCPPPARRHCSLHSAFKVNVCTDRDLVSELKTLFGVERQDPIDPVEIDPGHPRVVNLDPGKNKLVEMGKVFDKAVDTMVPTELNGQV
jgi:hypothetical protein